MNVLLSSRVACALLIVFLLQLHTSGFAQPASNAPNQNSTDQDIKQDYAQVLRQFEKAAAAGNAKAMYNMGVAYEIGKGVKQDDVKARQWYEKAAAAGFSQAAEALKTLPR